jgi:GT2 family glycosyltransferase
VWDATGLAGLVAEAFQRAGAVVSDARGDAYVRWLGGERRARSTAAQARDAIAQWAYQPFFSVVVPPKREGVAGERLERCVASVEAQYYPNWELRREAPVAAALRAAKGEFVAFLGGEGELAPEALYEVVRALNVQPGADVAYSDEDRLENGRRCQPFFKPDWAPEYCLSRLYVGQLVVYRRRVIDELGEAVEERADSDAILLHAVERTSRIVHVPKVLWHAFDEPVRSALPALQHHVARSEHPATVAEGPRPRCYRVRWRIRGEPLVSIIIATRDRLHLVRRCLESIETKTRGVRYEIVIVDNGSVEEPTRRYLAGCGHTVVRDPTPFNFARLNNAGATHGRGEHLLFLNNDTEVIDEEWLTALLELSQQETIGAVGAKLYYPDGRLQHVGVVLGLFGEVAQVFRGAPGTDPGYFDSSVVVRNYSAVTGACLMTRREVFETVGGFDERFAVDYNDVDYCLRVRRGGWRVAFTPHARLWHHEFATRVRRVTDARRGLFRRRWASEIAADPYYNPNLSRRHVDFRPHA